MFAFYDPRDMECTQAFAALAPHLGTAWFFAFNESKIPDSITETLRTRLSNVSHLVFDGPFQWDSCFSACEAATAGGNMTLRDLRITSNPLPMEVTDGMRAYLGLLPVGLEILYLTDDGITTLADGVFDRFVHLEVLHLDGNSIQSIPEGFFTKVPLQDLSLSGNNLSQFSLQGLDALQTLDVSNNLLSAMPSLNYASLPRLLELRIDSNSIERLPNDAFADASQLKILVLAGNGLAEIPAGLFDGNPLLGLVDLSRNALVSLPSGVFRNNPNLSGVNVGYNRITMLPDDLFSSGSNLLGLLLNDNQLAALPPHMIQGQRDLIGIGFENNRISELPEGYFDDCRQLTSLDMADNQISRLPKDAFAHNGMLTFLSMGSNKLSGMQQGSLFGQQSQLMSLNISYNHMLSLPDRPDWTGMSLIDVSGTSIQVHWRMCENAATVVLRGMTNMSLSSLESVVEACIGKATILDISDNDRVLNNISFVEHLLSGFSMPVRVAADDIITGTTTIIQMESSPTQCSLRRSMARRLLPRSLAGDVPHRLYAELPALMYTCECSEAYYRSGDGVCMSVPYWTGARAALLVLGLTIGVAGVVVYFVRLAQRRRRLFKADLELHQGLLQETQFEVEALKQAWGISAAEIDLVARIDGGYEGAFGEVWRGTWDGLDVAIKVLRSNVMAADQDVVAQFQKEIDFMQRTRHPHIVRFFGAGSFPSGAPFLVEELMDKSLQAYVQTTPDVPWAVKYKLLGDVSEGMQHIHNLGHMHRDLKTANVLINSRLQAKVADFGSMRELLLGGPVASATAGHRGADNAGAMSTNVGTPLYMSLEVLLGQPYDKAADTWSFGVVMWEVASQQDPDILAQEMPDGNHGPSGPRLRKVLKEGKRLLVDKAWPAELQVIMTRCWQEDAHLRPEFHELTQFFRHKTSTHA